MFIQATNDEYVSMLDMVDPKDQFEMASSKWNTIVEVINATRHSHLLCNEAICKDKWGVVSNDFKRLFNLCPKHVTTFSTRI
jgi:hypothetical protein